MVRGKGESGDGLVANLSVIGFQIGGLGNEKIVYGVWKKAKCRRRFALFY